MLENIVEPSKETFCPAGTQNTITHTPNLPKEHKQICIHLCQKRELANHYSL